MIEKADFKRDMEELIRICKTSLSLIETQQLREMSPKEAKQYKKLLGDYDYIVGPYKIKKLNREQ
jgi:uncharacterized protein YutD